MKDVNGNDFEAGQVVVCYDSIDGFLTYGKVYNVKAISPEQDRIIVIEDNNKEGWFKASRFEICTLKTRHDLALTETRKLWRN